MIDKVKSKYSKSVKKWPAHITLKQDEDFNIKSDKIANMLEESLKNECCIDAEVHKPEINYKVLTLRLLNNSGWNIYLPVKSKSLTILIQKTSKKLEPFIDTDSSRAFNSTKWEQSKEFYSHISIKGGKNREEGQKLLEKIINENFGLSFPLKMRCCSVILANWDSGKWRGIKTIRLKSKNV